MICVENLIGFSVLVEIVLVLSGFLCCFEVVDDLLSSLLLLFVGENRYGVEVREL